MVQGIQETDQLARIEAMRAIMPVSEICSPKLLDVKWGPTFCCGNDVPPRIKSGRTTVRPFTSMIVLIEISKTSIRHLAAAVPVVVAAGAGAGFLVAGAAGFAVAGTACLCEVLLTTAAVVG